MQYAQRNGMATDWTGIGLNYLSICRSCSPDVRGRPLALYAANGIEDVLRNRRSTFSYEYSCDIPGMRRWFQMRVTPLAESTGHVVVSHDDITNIKTAENDLRASRRQLQTILNSSPALIGYWNRDLRSVFANHAYFDWLGLYPHNVIGRHVLDVLGEELYTMNRPYIEKVLKGEPQEFERVFAPIGDNPARHSLVKYVPDIQDGEVLGFYVHVSDTTSVKLAGDRLREDERHKEATRIRRLELQRDAVVREVHHRIKNHLQGVIGLIQDRVRTMPEVAPQLKEAISQVRTIAEVYGLQSNNAKGTVPLPQLVGMAARSSMGGKAVRCRLPDGENTAFVTQTDAVPLALLINELVTNAIKHSDHSGQGRPVQISLEQIERINCIRVRNGPATLPPNFSLTANTGLGTGLELALTLLPSKGASLTLRQEGDEVIAELILTNPSDGDG